jgi:hypothetical protein
MGCDGGDGRDEGIGLALVLRDDVDAVKLCGMVRSEGQAEAMPTSNCSPLILQDGM